MCVCPGVSTSGLFYVHDPVHHHVHPAGKKTMAFVRNCENLCIFDLQNTHHMNHPTTYHHYIAYYHTATSIESVGFIAPDIKTARRSAQLYKRFAGDLKNCRTEVKRERKTTR